MMNGQNIAGETDQASGAELCLWRAVLIRAIEEWKSGPLRQKRQAEHYLFEDEVDFPLVCQSAGIDVGQLRTRLAKLRAKADGVGGATGCSAVA